MKDFHCSDIGNSCDFVARGKSTEVVLRQAAEHSREVHEMSMTRDVADTVEALIHDVDSEEHKRALGNK